MVLIFSESTCCKNTIQYVFKQTSIHCFGLQCLIGRCSFIAHVAKVGCEGLLFIHTFTQNGNKNGFLNPIINYTKYMPMYSRYHLYLHNSVEEIVVYNHLRIGYSYPTRSCFLHKDPQLLYTLPLSIFNRVYSNRRY